MASKNEANRVLFYTELTDTRTAAQGDKEGVGTLRRDRYGKVYRWVKNESSSNALRLGQPVCFDADDVAGATFLEQVVQEGIASGDIRYFAGIAMGAAPALGYCWVQVWGRHDTALVDITVIAEGDILIPHVSTDTAATAVATAKAYGLTVEWATAATGSTTLTPSTQILKAHCVGIDSVATSDTTITGAVTASVYIKAWL